jgi:hypothetical protein
MHVTAMWGDDDDVTRHELLRGELFILVSTPPHSDYIARLYGVMETLLVL